MIFKGIARWEGSKSVILLSIIAGRLPSCLHQLEAPTSIVFYHTQILQSLHKLPEILFPYSL